MRPFLLLLALLVALPACSLFGPDHSASDDLEQARERWAANKPTTYSFNYVKVCFCIGGLTPAKVRVDRETVTAVLDPQTGEPLRVEPDGALALETYPDEYLTVEQLFDVVAHALRSDADKLTVEYHPQLGYPTRIDIDYHTGMADDEVVYTATDLLAPARHD